MRFCEALKRYVFGLIFGLGKSWTQNADSFGSSFNNSVHTLSHGYFSIRITFTCNVQRHQVVCRIPRLWIGTVKGAKSVVRSMSVHKGPLGSDSKVETTSVLRSASVDSTGQVVELMRSMSVDSTTGRVNERKAGAKPVVQSVSTSKNKQQQNYQVNELKRRSVVRRVHAITDMDLAQETNLADLVSTSQALLEQTMHESLGSNNPRPSPRPLTVAAKEVVELDSLKQSMTSWDNILSTLIRLRGRHEDFACRHLGTEMLDMPVYRGEFGLQLTLALPVAFFIHSCGILASTKGCGNVSALYWFSEF